MPEPPNAGRWGLIALALATACVLVGGALYAWRPVARTPAAFAAAPAAASAAKAAGALAKAADPAALSLFTLSLDDADGRRRPVSEWRGKLLIVNFWATWCAPCIEEMPLLQQVADEFGQRNVAVIGIGVDDADKIRDFRAKLAIRFPLLVAGFDGMDLAQRLGNPEPVLPYTAVVSPSGRVVEQHSGRVQDSEVRRWVARHGHD